MLASPTKVLDNIEHLLSRLKRHIYDNNEHGIHQTKSFICLQFMYYEFSFTIKMIYIVLK